MKISVCNSTTPDQSFKCEPHKMVKHTQTMCRLLLTNCLSVFDHFVGLVLKGLKSFDRGSCTFLFVRDPNFPVGNKCGWLSSSQNASLGTDSGLIFSPHAIDINSFSHDVITKTVSFALHFYASRGFSRNSAQESIL